MLLPTICCIPAVFLGDEILAVNGEVLHGLSHEEAISIFKRIKAGPVVLQIGRRGGSGHHQHQAKMQTKEAKASNKNA